MKTHMDIDRPQMPQGYGVGDPQYGFEPIEWSWVANQMSESRNYWVTTTRPSGTLTSFQCGEYGYVTSSTSSRTATR